MRRNGIPVLSRDGNKNRHVVISLDVCVLGPGRLHKAVRGYTAEHPPMAASVPTDIGRED